MSSFLPYGLQLKSLLVGSMLTDGDLKRCLAQRGVFVSNSDKDTTVPLFMTYLLSPSEFAELKQNQVTHEENIKHFTRYLELNTGEFSLLDVLEDKNLRKAILPVHRNYELTNAPSFRGNKDRVVMDYEIERKNPTKDWTESRTKHNGRVIMEKKGTKVKMQVEWSVAETKDLSNRILGDVRRQVQSKGLAGKDTRMERILASAYTNTERTRKLLAFTAGDAAGRLILKKVSNVNFGPDPTVKNLPDDIAWMQQRVRSMLVRGEGLHTLAYFTKDEYRACLILDMIETNFEFELNGFKGNCVVVFGFPGYLKGRGQDIEFEVSPGRISWARVNGAGKTGGMYPSKQATDRYILSIFEDMKEKIFSDESPAMDTENREEASG